MDCRSEMICRRMRCVGWRDGRRIAGRRARCAIANALEGMSRADAARLAGMERQALRDAVLRYNAEGLAGLHNRGAPPRPGKLDEAELRALSALILRGPDPEVDGLSSWTLPELCRVIEERFNKRLHPASLSRIIRRRSFSRQNARQRHPQLDRSAQEAFQRGPRHRTDRCEAVTSRQADHAVVPR